MIALFEYWDNICLFLCIEKNRRRRDKLKILVSGLDIVLNLKRGDSFSQGLLLSMG